MAQWNIESDIYRLLSTEKILGAFLISRKGRFVGSWTSRTASSPEALNLIQIGEVVVPRIAEMSDIGLERALFQIKGESVYFAKVLEDAMLGCLLAKDFNFIKTTFEIHKTAFILSSKLRRRPFDEAEYREYTRRILKESSSLISGSIGQLKKHVASSLKKSKSPNAGNDPK